MKDLLENVLRYVRFLITVSLGIFFAFFAQLKPFLKNPITATALIGFFLSSFALLYFTLLAMLGLEPMYG